MTRFNELGLGPNILKKLEKLGFLSPTPIQEKTIPFILENKQDLIALAQTGTGKTAAFGLPILEQIKSSKTPEVLVICPTRELCLQISDDLRSYAEFLKNINVLAVYGGERIDIQIKRLKEGPNVIVGTPGRVHDLIRRGLLKFSNIKWLVLDEADEMLDMGFKDDLDAILSDTPKEKKTFLFSATMSASVRKIAQRYMTNAGEISVVEKNTAAKNICHEYYVVNAREKFEALERILSFNSNVYGILFCRTRIETQNVSDKLREAGYETEALHGDISQVNRSKIMARFKARKIKLLVATDVAARGIDVNDLTHVINFNLPDQREVYTHRSGRTGRAGKKGISITICGPRERRIITEFEKNIGQKFEYKQVPNYEDVCRKQVDDFVENILKSEETNLEKFADSESITKLSKINKEDLIGKLVSYKLSQLLSRKSSADLNAPLKSDKPRIDDANKSNIKIDIGRNKGLDVKDVFRLLNKGKNTSGVSVGKIVISNTFSIVSVEKSDFDKVLKHLNSAKFKGIKITASADNYKSQRTFTKSRPSSRQRRGNKKRRRQY